MSIATLTAAATGPPPHGAPGEPADWITLAEASRILGVHSSSVMRAALAGSIATRRIAGIRTRYSRADVQRLAN